MMAPPCPACSSSRPRPPRLHIPPSATLHDPAALAAHLRTAGTTITFAPTPVAELLIRDPALPATRLRDSMAPGTVPRQQRAAPGAQGLTCG